MTQTRQFISMRDAQWPFFVGVDLGGTGAKIGVIDNLGRPLSWLSIPTDAAKGPEAASQRIGQAVLKAIADADLQPAAIARVGLGSAGILDTASGILVKPVNLKGWEMFPLREWVSAHCGLPVTLVNDANAAAYGEFWIGSGRDFRSMVFLTLGTGIGCGIIVDDTVIEGVNGHGAECGHIVIDYADDARMCGCGQRGHLEAYASATAVIRRMREALESERPSSMRRRIADGAPLTPKLLAEEAEAGDAMSLELIAETARFLAVGIVNLMHTIDPSGVLLGGAMTFGGHDTTLGLRFLGWVKQEVNRRAFPMLAARTVIDFATLGGDAGYIGAAGMARLEHGKMSRVI